MTDILFEHGPFDLNGHKFTIILEKEKHLNNNLSITLVHLSSDFHEFYPLCLLHGSKNQSEFLLKQSSSIVDISGEKYFWFAEQRLSDKLLIIKFSTLRRRSDLCKGVTLAFQQSIHGSFLLQNSSFEAGLNQLSEIVVKMGFGVDSNVQKGQPVILPDVQSEIFIPQDGEEEKQEKMEAVSSKYQNVSHSQICFLRVDGSSFQLKEVLFQINEVGDIRITCNQNKGESVIPAQNIEGMDLPTIVRILIANSQFLQVKNGRFYCDWSSLISHQKVMTIQPLKLAVDISTLSFDLSDLSSLETIISFVQLNSRVFKGATKFVAEVPSQGGINKALLPKYAQWKLVIISLDSRLLKKFYRLVFTENDAIELLIGLGYPQQEFSSILNDFPLMSSILIRSLYFDQHMVSLLSSLQLAKERQGSIENLKDLIELNGVFAATSDQFKSPQSFNTDDPYSSLKSTLIEQKKLRGLSDQSMKAFLKLIQVQYSGKIQYRVEIEEASEQLPSFKTSFTFSSSRDNQKFKLALYSAKLMRGSILVNLTILEDSFPHKVSFALTDNKGEVLWKFKKEDHNVNQILASSTKSWILKSMLSQFSNHEELLPLSQKSAAFETLPSIIDSQDDRALQKDDKGVYFKISHNESKLSYLGVKNLSENSGVMMLESIGSGLFALGMSVNTVNIVAHNAFSAFSQCLLDQNKIDIQYSATLQGKERSDFYKVLQFLVASFQFSPASLPLKKYLKNQGLHSQTMRRIELEKIKVLEYEVSTQGLQCEVKVSKVEVEQKPYILQIVVEDLAQKSNRQETYIAVSYLLPEIQEKEVASNSELFRKEVRKALTNSLIIMNSYGKVQFSIEKAKEIQTSNNTERLMTLFSDQKLLDHQIVNQDQFGKVEIEIFQKQEVKKRMQKYYTIKVWNPEDYSLIAKKTLSSEDLEAIKTSIRKQNEGSESMMEFANVGSFLLEHIYLRKVEDHAQILFT